MMWKLRCLKQDLQSVGCAIKMSSIAAGPFLIVSVSTLLQWSVLLSIGCWRQNGPLLI